MKRKLEFRTRICAVSMVSDANFYRWRSKSGAMDVSDARKLRQLESENAKLKRLLADAMLDKAALGAACRNLD